MSLFFDVRKIFLSFHGLLRRIFILRNCLWLIGCGGLILLAEPGQAGAEQQPSFLSWCTHPASLSQAQQKTLQVLLEVANTQNCLSAHSALTQLTSLSLVDQELSDIAPLASLTHLRFLTLSFSEVVDIRPLAHLTQLQTVVLEGNQIQDLSPLQKLPQLKSIIALNNPLKSRRCPLLPVSICVFSDDGATLVQEALTYVEQGNFNQARLMLEQAKILYEQQDDPMRLGDVLSHLADLNLKVGRYAEAIAGYDQAIALRQQLGDLPGVGTSLVQQSIALEQLGLIQESAEKLALAAKNTDRQWMLGIPLEGGLYELPKDTATLYRNLAIVQNRLGEFRTALTSAQRSLHYYDYLPDDYAGKQIGIQATLAITGLIYDNLELQSQSQATLEKALDLARSQNHREGIGQLLTLLGERAFRHGQFSSALAYLQEALAIQTKLGNQPEVGKTLHLLGSTQLELGQHKSAVETLGSAVEIWESLRPGLSDSNKVALAETQRATYERLQMALIARHQPEEALAVSERARARAFLELIAFQANKETDGPLKQAQPPSVREIQAIAKQQNATLVEYSIADSMLIIWVVQPSGVISIRTQDLSQLPRSLDQTSEQARLAANSAWGSRGMDGSQSAIAELVRSHRDSLLNPTTTQTRATVVANVAASGDSTSRSTNHHLRSAYQVLIEPIADLLPRDPDQKVMIVPQGPLFLVPFAALQDDQGTYLIEQHTLGYTPAISVLALTQRLKETRQLSNQSAGDALVVGNPTMPSVPFAYDEKPVPLSPLLGAESEAIAVASMLKVNALIGPEATESTVAQRMTSAPVLHLATHGLLDELKYLGLRVPGAIALAPEGQVGQNDGLLTSEEILQMNLIADLVVLSACNTGRGKITGDGVVGLSRSFMSAGAASVMVSLWAVPDAQTSALMQAFYQQWQQEPDKAKALRHAMLKTMKYYPDPQDWAAFILMGSSL